jgi:hypothetical protein
LGAAKAQQRWSRNGLAEEEKTRQPIKESERINRIEQTGHLAIPSSKPTPRKQTKDFDQPYLVFATRRKE